MSAITTAEIRRLTTDQVRAQYFGKPERLAAFQETVLNALARRSDGRMSLTDALAAVREAGWRLPSRWLFHTEAHGDVQRGKRWAVGHEAVPFALAGFTVDQDEKRGWNYITL